MKNRIIVRRYADAFLEYSRMNIGREMAIKELLDTKGILRDNPGFLELLSSPEITYAEKCVFLDDVLRAGFSDELGNFLKLLVKKGRIDLFVDIIDYVRVNFSHGDEVEAHLKTSFPLELGQIEEIKAGLEKKLNKKFKLYIELDGSLLGGIQVVIGNTVIDGSVRRRIDDLKEKLMTVRVS